MLRKGLTMGTNPSNHAQIGERGFCLAPDSPQSQTEGMHTRAWMTFFERIH